MSAPEGLTVYHDVLSEKQEKQIIDWLDTQPWSTELSRRTQHYGFHYTYASKNISALPDRPLAGPLKDLADWLSTNQLLTPNQCIVNEYTRCQGIAPHIDKKEFGPVIAGFSLGGEAVMNFTRGEQTYDYFLPRRSLLIMSGPARSQWSHGLSKNVTFRDANGVTQRKPDDYRRISLTYRTY